MKDTKKDFIAAILAIVIILLIILIVLVSYGIFGKKDKSINNDTVEVYSVNSSVDITDVESLNKIDEKEDIVYDKKYNYELNFDGTKFEINSVMPIINIDNNKIHLINEEIKNYYENVKLNEEMYELRYDKYIYEDILSIVIQKQEKRTDGIKNISNVVIYNINQNTGEIISNRELINKKNTSLDKICLELLNTISKDLKANYKFDISDKSFLIDNKKTAEDYIKEEIYVEKDYNLGNTFKMYINEKGKICISFYVPILNTNEKFTYSSFIINL
jgi:hypothetical protein